MTDVKIDKEIQERSERLRKIRNFTNLSRKELCENTSININTYIGYEVGKYGGLTKKSAQKIIDFATTRGVYSSIDWLMYGLGNGPKVITSIEDNVICDNLIFVPRTPEEHNISEELSLFYKHYNHAKNFIIEDDGMLPFYGVGDHVAGIYEENKQINYLIGHDCILKTLDGLILVRNLRKGKKQDSYILFCVNSETKVDYPILYDVELVWAAKIIWHRKTHQSKENP